MGATNSTTYYNLSQFVGTDKPAWLQDYNGDMVKIDAGIHQAKAAADAAQGDATQALTDSGNNTTAIGNLQTDVGNLQTATGNNAGAINSINSLIGNGTPTTTDQTIIGAINELLSDITKRTTVTDALTASASVSTSRRFAYKTFRELYIYIHFIATANIASGESVYEFDPDVAKTTSSNFVISEDIEITTYKIKAARAITQGEEIYFSCVLPLG